MSLQFREIAPEFQFDYRQPIIWMFEGATVNDHPYIYTALATFWNTKAGIFDILPQLHTNDAGTRCYYSVFFKHHSGNPKFNCVIHIYVSARFKQLRILSVDIIQGDNTYVDVILQK